MTLNMGYPPRSGPRTWREVIISHQKFLLERSVSIRFPAWTRRHPGAACAHAGGDVKWARAPPMHTPKQKLPGEVRNIMKIKEAVVDQAGDNREVRNSELLEHEYHKNDVLEDMQST